MYTSMYTLMYIGMTTHTHILRCVFFVLSTYYNMMWIIIKMHNGPVQNVCSKHLVLFMPDIQRMLALLAGCHRHPGHLWPNAISSYHLEMVKTSIMSGQIDDGWTFGWTSLLRFFYYRINFANLNLWYTRCFNNPMVNVITGLIELLWYMANSSSHNKCYIM